ncbi:MAG: truB [Marmoricola sp.]|nr:truB [Marmoricola sp.]
MSGGGRSTGVPSGLVVVDKPGGLTSHDVVSRVRRLAGTRKVGHAGTLDPMATGVLVLGVERATRLLGHLLVTDKVYEATIRLGASTTTDDAEGEVTATAATDAITEQQVRDTLAGFVGEIDQVPSTVSAIKVDGRRAYERVRAGEDVDLPSRRVRISGLEVRALRGADIDVVVHCSSGTYIRAIARDLGATLGVGGHLTALRRTAVGAFGLDRARTLEQLAEDVSLVPIAVAARETFACVDLDDAAATDVRFGRRLERDLAAEAGVAPGAAPVAVFDPAGEFLALYEQAGPLAKAVAVFV